MTVKFREKISAFPPAHLESIAQIIGDTESGLTGSVIGHKLAQCKIPDQNPSMTKWKRLYNALALFQNEHKVGNHVIVFTNEVMNPASYTNTPELFQSRREQLNIVLALSGFNVGGDGRVRRVTKVDTLDEALVRSNRMREQLNRRNAHAEVIRFCDAEIIANNNFHAVLEAMKSITSRIRYLSGLTTDGAELVKNAFSFDINKAPLLTMNKLDTKTLKSEQHGFVNILIGLYGMVRNPIAHEP